MDDLVIGELTARLARPDPGALEVRFAGRSSSREAGKALAPLFARVLAAAREERRTAVLRFEGLDYFNSSTIAALVQLVRAAQEAGVRLEVVYDARRRWQAMSFDALRRALRPLHPSDPGPTVTFREA